MWLQNFLRAKPVVDLDPHTGNLRLVGLDELPEDVPLVDISEKLHGSYLDESDEIHVKFGSHEVAGSKKYFRYWLPDNVRFHFQDSDGTRIEIDGKRYATIEGAKDVAGNPVGSQMVFSIYEPDGQLI